MEEFGFALRVAREKRGLTQTQVMQLTGINNKTRRPAAPAGVQAPGPGPFGG